MTTGKPHGPEERSGFIGATATLHRLISLYLVSAMDEIEKGFEKIKEKIDQLTELQEKGKTLSEKVRSGDAKLLEKMAKSAEPVVKKIGLNMLKKGKQDTKGEIYDPQYYSGKMIILGKSDPAPCRPTTRICRWWTSSVYFPKRGIFSS